MNRFFASCLILPSLLLSGQAVAQQAAAKPSGIVVERTYWVRPGKEKQFAMLFERTQLPRLKTLLDGHQILSFSTAAPLLHTSNEQWAYRLKVKWISWDAYATDALARNDQKSNSTLTYEQALFGDLVIDRKDTVIQEDLYDTTN